MSRIVHAGALSYALLTAGLAWAGPVLDREVAPYETLRDDRSAAAWEELLRDALGIPTRIGIFRPSGCSAGDRAAGLCEMQDDDAGGGGGHDDDGGCGQC